MHDSSLKAQICIIATFSLPPVPVTFTAEKPAFNDQLPIKINEVSLHEIIAWGMSHILNIIPKLEATGMVRKFPRNNVSGITINIQANERSYNIQHTH